MDITKHYNYGFEVVEFFKHDDNELQKLVAEREEDYFRRSESLLHPETGVQISWSSNQPMAAALKELTELLLQGYTVVTAYAKPLDFNVQLRKPNSLIDSNLINIRDQAKADYDEERYTRNVAEMRRQMDFTIAKRARDAAAVAAKTAEKHRVSEDEFALADLLKAYAPTKSKTAKSIEVA
ncbi:hypothetical protein [Pseudomonas moraviensis]